MTHPYSTVRRSVLLVEVLAAVLILGGSVVALLVAQSRAVQQSVANRQVERASTLAAELLAAWRLEKTDIRIQDEGVFEGDPNWFWRRTVEQDDLAGIAVLRITLTVHQQGSDGSITEYGRWDWLELPDVPDE